MVRVLSIVGAGRSGTTILDNIIGSVAGGFSAGELRYLWQRGLVEGRLCGCGRVLAECELWPRVLHRAYPGGPDIGATVTSLEMLRTRYLPAARLPFLRDWYDRRLEPLTATLDKLYPAIAAETGARFIVDSSKIPAYSYVLSRAPSIDLKIIHLVRDAPAVVYSCGRIKQQLDTPEQAPMRREGPVRSALDWIVWNESARSLLAANPGGYRLLRYEDFITDPTTAVRMALELVGEADTPLPPLSGRIVRLPANHTVAGNPSRFLTGDVPLELDETWQLLMPPWKRRLVTALTASGRRRYGYR